MTTISSTDADICPKHKVKKTRLDLPSGCRRCHEEALEHADRLRFAPQPSDFVCDSPKK